MDIKQSPEDIRKERIFSLEAENERLAAINCEYIRELSRLNDESNSLWEKLREVSDREIVMGEKIKRLKEFAETTDMYEPFDLVVLVEKIKEL